MVAVRDLAVSRELWRRAGFGVTDDEFRGAGMRIARMAAGAVEIDLCSPSPAHGDGPWVSALEEAVAAGGGVLGWVWGSKGAATDNAVDGTSPSKSPALPRLSAQAVDARALSSGLPGVTTAVAEIGLDIESRRVRLRELCGGNANTVDYLEHIVVMTPMLEDAIAALGAVGVACKRIREVGNGARQAFFKLEQTVIEVVGPARAKSGCWGLALMCSDIAQAVAVARDNGLQATEPKTAIQGGKIARIVEPLDRVAVAYMEPGPRIDD
jgi:predicted enzyme related to lactoylglutathione lyase